MRVFYYPLKFKNHWLTANLPASRFAYCNVFPQFPEGPFEIRTSCTTLSRLPIAVELRCSYPADIQTPLFPLHKCGHPRQYLQNSSHHECLEGLQAPDGSLPRVLVLSTHGRPLSLSSNCSLLLLFFWMTDLVLSCSPSRSIA